MVSGIVTLIATGCSARPPYESADHYFGLTPPTGWKLATETSTDHGNRLVQFTPTGSTPDDLRGAALSILWGRNDGAGFLGTWRQTKARSIDLDGATTTAYEYDTSNPAQPIVVQATVHRDASTTVAIVCDAVTPADEKTCFDVFSSWRWG